MARLYTLPMSAWVNFANHMVESSVERMQEASERLQERKYKPSDLFADTVGFWMDGVDAWWCTFQQAVGGPVPFVFMQLRPDEEAAAYEMPIRKVAGSSLKATNLVKIGSAVPAKSLSVTAAWSGNRPNCAVVNVYGLSKKQLDAGEELEEGLYQSSVHMDEKLVAIVQVLVERGARPQTTGSRAAKRAPKRGRGA